MEAQTGAGTTTITNKLAERINDGAAPADKVTANALTQRVRRNITFRNNKKLAAQQPDMPTKVEEKMVTNGNFSKAQAIREVAANN